MKSELRTAGLTDNEAEIYTVLLSLKKATASEIASKSNISRPHVYDSIQRLIEKGLASYFIQSGRKQFIASSPSKLLEYMNEQETKLREKKEKIKQILPELERLKEKEETGPIIEIFEGKEGLKTVFSDLIKDGNDYYVLNASNDWTKYNPDIVEWLDKEKRKSKSKAKCLTSIGREGVFTTDIYKKIPNEQYGPSTTIVYGDKVFFILGSKNLTTVLAKSKDLAETYRKQFDSMWSQNTTVFKGFEGMKNVFNEMLSEMKEGESYYVVGSNRQVMQMEGWFVDFHKRRLAKKVKVSMLTHNNFYTDAVNIFKKSGEKDFLLTSVKSLPPEIENPVQINLYKNKVLFILWKEPAVIQIESKYLYQSLKDYFDTLWNQDTKIFKGTEAVRSVFYQMIHELKENESYYVIGVNNYPQKIEPFFVEFHKERLKRKINAFLLANTDMMDILREEIIDRAGDKKSDLTFIKSMPSGIDAPMQINLYKNKVIFIMWKEPAAIMIESKNLYDSLKNYFDTLWNQDVRVFHGLEGIKNLLNDTLNYKEVKFIAAGGYLEKRMPDYFFNQYVPKAKKLGIKWKQLAQKHTKNMRMMHLDFMECKIIEEDTYGPNVVWIYGNKIVNVLWKKEPIAFMIDNKEIADGYRKYFELLWMRKT